MMSPEDRERAVAALRKRGLTKADLEKRLEEHRSDRNFKAATQTAYSGAIEQAGVIRRLFSERLDAYKWIAAISTAALFFLGQALGSIARPLRYDAGVAALIAEVCFLLSVLGAALYTFIVDRRASAWHRALFIRTSHVMMLLGGIDASGEELREGIERQDLKAANASFWEMYDAKQELGRATAESGMNVPREGRLAGFASALCLGGLVLGLVGAALYEWSMALSVTA